MPCETAERILPRMDSQGEAPLSPRFEKHLHWMETESKFAHACPDLDQEPPEPPVAVPPNPKQLYGDKKVPLAYVPSSAIIAMALAARLGAIKYDPYNWRELAIEVMTYLHASLRHIQAYIDGEDIDPESLLPFKDRGGNLVQLEAPVPHLGAAMMCLAIIVDAEANGMLIDNRPNKGTAGEQLRKLAAP